MKKKLASTRSNKRRSTKRIILPPAGNATGKKFTEAKYRAIVEQMYEQEAQRIMKGHRLLRVAPSDR